MLTSLTTLGATALSAWETTSESDLAAPSQAIRSVAALLVWVQLLSYLRGFQAFAPYVHMLLAIIADMIPFLMIYLLIILAFAHAMLMYGEDLRGLTFPETVAVLVRRVLAMYRLGTLGDFESSDFEDHWVRYAYFVGVTVLISVVMLNVLIAVISDTFDRLLERSESSFVKSLTQLIAEIESIFGPWDPPAFTPYSRIQDGARDEWAGRVGALVCTIHVDSLFIHVLDVHSYTSCTWRRDIHIHVNCVHVTCNLHVIYMYY